MTFDFDLFIRAIFIFSDVFQWTAFKFWDHIGKSKFYRMLSPFSISMAGSLSIRSTTVYINLSPAAFLFLREFLSTILAQTFVMLN
jgi:hypothetical protein